jgi:hypothetical protein
VDACLTKCPEARKASSTNPSLRFLCHDNPALICTLHCNTVVCKRLRLGCHLASNPGFDCSYMLRQQRAHTLMETGKRNCQGYC